MLNRMFGAVIPQDQPSRGSARRSGATAASRPVAFIPLWAYDRISMEGRPKSRRLEWVGNRKKDLLALPEEVVDVFGYAFYLARKQSAKERES